MRPYQTYLSIPPGPPFAREDLFILDGVEEGSILVSDPDAGRSFVFVESTKETDRLNGNPRRARLSSTKLSDLGVLGGEERSAGSRGHADGACFRWMALSVSCGRRPRTGGTGRVELNIGRARPSACEPHPPYHSPFDSSPLINNPAMSFFVEFSRALFHLAT